MIACAAPFHILDLWPLIGAAAGAVAFYRPKVMQLMRKILSFLFALLFMVHVTGCASAWKTAYVGGAVTAEYVTDLHKNTWSEPLNARAEECDEKLDPSTDTKADFDACMGEYALDRQEKVEAGLKAYNAAAGVLAKVLLATNPEQPRENRDQLLSAWLGVLSAARTFVELLPGSDKYLKQLDTLTKGL